MAYRACAPRLWPFVVALLAIGTARGDPPVSNPPGVELPRVFCFRITDIERVPGDMTGNAFIFEFEVLNWTNSPARGLSMASNIGTTAVVGAIPTITAIGIDPNGRGGALGGNDIGSQRFDGDGLSPPGPLSPQLGAIHNGRGRGDLPNLLNDWSTASVSGTSAVWTAGTTGTSIPFRDLLGTTSTAQANALVPGDPVLQPNDARGDIAIDGGPGITIDPVVPDGSGNVLDGFTLTIEDFDVGERISLNWFSLDANGQPHGSVGRGNQFGFGVLNLARIPVGGPLPGGVFAGNTGFRQSPIEFFDSVFLVPNPAEFGSEFGAGITATFLNPADNTFNVGINRLQVIPEPGTLLLTFSGATLLLGAATLRRRT